MKACDNCGKVVEKDAQRVERGMSYICAICVAHMAHSVGDSQSTAHPKRKKKHRRDQSPRGSEVSLGGYDFSKKSKRPKNEAS